MITIAVDEITERLKYTFDFIFVNNGVNYQFVVLGAADLDYRKGGSSFEVSNLLYEKGVGDHQIELSAYRGIGCFKIDGKKDPVATVFFILSRYEEYLSTELDEHKRFKHGNSFQFKFGLLEKPIADHLSKAILGEFKLEIAPEKRRVEIIPTFDIDNVYAYKLKSGVRRWGAIVRDVINRDSKRLKERKTVDIGGEDPYDTYDLIMDIAKGNENTIAFWLCGGNSKYDRNIDLNNEAHVKLIKEINSVCTVGLHPSYSSYNDENSIGEEKRILSKVLGDTVVHSRFHYLHFTLPHSYRTLIQSGLYSDYSMGYAGQCGFRAGTAKSFLWYDLEKDEVTGLRIFPFTYMDGTLNEYMRFSPEAAKERVRSLYDEIAICGGNMIAIWHNETIGDYNHWKGWKDVLQFNLGLNG